MRPEANWAVMGPIGRDGGDGLSESDAHNAPHSFTQNRECSYIRHVFFMAEPSEHGPEVFQTEVQHL